MDLYLDNMSKKYRIANRRQKGVILGEMCSISGYHKKHAIRLLNQRKKRLSQAKVVETRGRPEQYSATVYLEPLKQIWLSTDQLCGKRLKMAMPLWLPHYPTEYGKLESKVYEGLLSMSASTIYRLLASSRVKGLRGLSGTKPGKILKKHIPIKNRSMERGWFFRG